MLLSSLVLVLFVFEFVLQFLPQYCLLILLNIFVNYFGTSFDYIFGFTNDISFKAFVKDLNIIEIGKRLKDVRKEKKYTQDYIAKILNTNHSVWCRYEQGKYLINTTFLYAFSEKTKVSSDYLLGKTDSPKYFK